MAILSTETDINQHVASKNITDEFASILSQENKIIIQSGFDVKKTIKLKIMLWVLYTYF